MKVIAIDKKGWAGGLEALKSSYRLFGPVKEGKVHEFRSLGPGQVPDLDFQNTRLSAKGLIYPQGQKLFDYTVDETQPDHHVLREVPADSGRRAVIGIRPCDADAFALVRRNFDTPEYRDPYWLGALEATTLVGLACAEPCGTCFCTTAGSGPHSEENLDLLLVDAGDHYLARCRTAKGEALLAAAGWSQAAPAGADEKTAALRQAAEGRIASRVATEMLAQKVTTDLYEAPFWEDVAFSCINCGTCTFVCPTCWCFDIQDEVQGQQGVRLRHWDTCMAPLFTLHGSGHNPRNTKVQRVRQRFMHKLKYYVDKYGNGIQCVGCGRCVRACPVNIDIRRVCELMNAYNTDACACNIAS